MAFALSQLLHHFLSEHSDWRVHLAHQWRTIFGAPAGLLRLRGMRARRIVIAVADSRWLHELRALTPHYVKRIQIVPMMPAFESIEWIYDPSIPRVTAAVTRPVFRSSPVPIRCEQALAQIQDPALKALIAQCISNRPTFDES